MSFLTSLFTGGDSIKAIGDTVDQLFTSDEEKLAARLELTKAENEFKVQLATMDTQLAMGQIDINKKEAESSSIWVAGWRPAVGWVCVVAISYTFVLEPLFRFIAQVMFQYDGNFPVIETSDLNSLLLGLLGLGGLRTYEKVKGV